MKNLTTLFFGVGLIALQGCSGAMTPEEVASNESAVTSCGTAQGLFTTKAALAVAMATELGRWDAVNDLSMGSWTTDSYAKCGSSCKRTSAILGQQDFTSDQQIFSTANYWSDLKAAFSRQGNYEDNLKMNHPELLPPAHKLTKVAGPVNLGKGACGAHYVFQADNPNGTALTATQARNLRVRLCYFGMDSTGNNCGGNPWLAFSSGTNADIAGCPKGRYCVAIDPDGNDNGVPPDTSAGAIPQYQMNRFYDPNNTTLGTQCQKYNSNPAILGKMQSKCASYPSTCGYLYCI